MKGLTDLAPGDEAFVLPLYRHGGAPTPVTVVSVARVWITVTGGSGYYKQKYRKDTGAGTGDPAQDELMTADMLADREERTAAIEALYRSHARVSMHWSELSTDQLKRIADVIGE